MPICSVDISLVKIGTVIIDNPLVNKVEIVYTTPDFSPSEALANGVFIQTFIPFFIKTTFYSILIHFFLYYYIF